jgi:hypothetical protein
MLEEITGFITHEESWYLIHAGSLFDPEDVGDKFIRNVCCILMDYMAF